MRIKHNILLISFLILLGCSETSHSNRIINLVTKKITLLKTSYHYKIFKDGVGPDTTKPIYSDTIIILNNELSREYKFNNIHKIKYLDSASLCKMINLYDEKRIVFKPFLFLERKSDTIKIFAITWVTKFYDFENHNAPCVELERELIQSYLPN